jgi:UDP-N-acetyl-D-galactosamine dehydrogenase
MSVVAVVGLGYVGLPLAVEFGKKFRTIGYDLSAEKVANYRHPEVILAGRRINDDMGKFIAEQTVKELIRSGHAIKGARVNILGLTFKEDVPDLRNSRVIDVISELKSYGIDVHVHDPVTDARDAMHEYGIELVPWDALPRADALIVAVAHKRFIAMSTTELAAKLVPRGCFVDVKARFDASALQKAGCSVWRL